jgi:hypothetical protein
MKITITRLLETSKYLATEAGKQLEGMITQTAEFMDQGVRSLRNGLTFRDNFDAEGKTLSLKDGVATVVASSKTVTGILITRTVSTTYALSSFLWYYDSNSKLTVKATFTPTPSEAVDLEAVFLF